MKVVIIGANGQLGTSLIKNIPSKIIIYPFKKNELDVSNFNLLKKTIGKIRPMYLINCAAYTNVNNAEKEKDLCNLINTKLLENLSYLSNLYDFNLIHFSTDFVFDGEKRNYKEIDKKNPLNNYGLSKSNGEDIVINKSKNYLIFRISSLFSPYGNNFVKTILNNIEKKKYIEVIDDQFSKPTCAIDISLFIWNNIICKKMNKINEIFHFCNNNESISWFDFANLIYKIYSNYEINLCKIKPISSINYKQAASRPKFSNLDTEKLEKYFNFAIPKLEQSLYRTIEMSLNKEL